ncbi:MAG: hypothetical protein DRQ88_05900 [Epsilonproteobacteria bacterium]|nr:MAG: hypothetical protein DRQ88_05900 [Campylobacterota bacterium]
MLDMKATKYLIDIKKASFMESKFKIVEKAFSRLIGRAQKHDWVFLTGFRGEYSFQENMARNEQIRKRLLPVFGSPIIVRGRYTEAVSIEDWVSLSDKQRSYTDPEVKKTDDYDYAEELWREGNPIWGREVEEYSFFYTRPEGMDTHDFLGVVEHTLFDFEQETALVKVNHDVELITPSGEDIEHFKEDPHVDISQDDLVRRLYYSLWGKSPHEHSLVFDVLQPESYNQAMYFYKRYKLP